MPITLSPGQARRVAVRAQLLDDPRPESLLDVVRRLDVLQNDPTSAVTPSADLVLWSRLGSGYDRAELVEALEAGLLLEYRQMIRPADHIGLIRDEMAHWPGRGELRPWQHEVADWVEANDACRRDILELLRGDGPLPTSALPDTCVRTWGSTGWTNDKNVQRLLDFMVQRGEVALAGREGQHKVWDLAERVYPDVPVVPEPEATRVRHGRTLRSLGLARPREVGDAGEPALVDGVRGRWRVDPEQLERDPDTFRGRVAVLSPLDRLVFDRKRMAELFAFDYQLEMYKPAARRRWGYWAMPVLDGDRLVGKVDATTDREAGVLVVDAIHRDPGFTDATRAGLDAELASLAAWLDVELVVPG